MSFTFEGDYFEGCSAGSVARASSLNPATNDTCESFIAWHITKGLRDGVDLAGFNVALAVHSPKQMTDGGWRVALYLDERANPDQAAALGAIFSGQAGGHLANLAPLIDEFKGMDGQGSAVRSTRSVTISIRPIGRSPSGLQSRSRGCGACGRLRVLEAVPRVLIWT